MKPDPGGWLVSRFKRIRYALKPDPRFFDERTQSVGAEALFAGWVLQMVGLSGALLYRLLVLGQGPRTWWDSALIVHVGYWLAAVLFAVASRWALHAALPLGASLLGTCLTALLSWSRVGLAPWRSVAAGLFSAPLWHVGGMWVLYGLRRRAPTDERIEAARGRAMVAGGGVLFFGIVGSSLVRIPLALISRNPRSLPIDIWILWLLSAGLSGWLFRAWGGVTPESKVDQRQAILRSWPRICATHVLSVLLMSYAFQRDWARARSFALAALTANLIFTLIVWLNRQEGVDE